MLLQEPPESPYDLRFDLFGFPIRIAWTFWLGAIFIGHSLASSLDRMFEDVSPGRFPLLIVWVVCLFVSILIHELGHAFAHRRYGMSSSIVLYHFGGFAIPTGGYTPSKGFRFAPVTHIGPKEQLVISAAGPAAQLASAGVVILICKLLGYGVTVFGMMPAGLNRIPWVQEGEMISNPALFALVTFYLFPSVLWAFLNLLPVWPMDGGKISRSIFQLTGGEIGHSLWLSLLTAVFIAYYGFTGGNMFLAIMFAMMAYGNYQMLEGQRGNY